MKTTVLGKILKCGGAGGQKTNSKLKFFIDNIDKS